MSRMVVGTFIFFIVLNLASGAMMTTFPTLFGDQAHNKILYQSSYGNEMTNSSTKSINPSPDLQDPSNAFARLLDKITIGYYSLIQSTIKTYVLGVPTIMTKIFPETNVFINFIGELFIFAFVLFGFNLWSGNKLKVA